MLNVSGAQGVKFSPRRIARAPEAGKHSLIAAGMIASQYRA
jgi:hypothetical protein